LYRAVEDGVSSTQCWPGWKVDAQSDEILGVTAFSVEASDLMTTVQIAMVGRMPFTMLRDAIFTHPTASEGLVFLLGQIERREGRRHN
jgi:pyruvate/2-oxoglutarate dehydrogenase complex dihydrolipoamide dehydrogenase (E3) component